MGYLCQVLYGSWLCHSQKSTFKKVDERIYFVRLRLSLVANILVCHESNLSAACVLSCLVVKKYTNVLMTKVNYF